MKNQNKIKKSQIFISLFLLSLLILLAPHVIRDFRHDSIMMGDESYYHARISRQIMEEKAVPEQDVFVHGERDYPVNPYHFVLAALSFLTGVILASKIIPFACGLVSALVFYFILKRLGFDELNRIVILIVFLFSPVFIYVFSLSTPFCMIIMLDLIGFYLFMQKEKRLFIISLFILIAASFFSLSNLAIIFLLTLSYTLAFEKKKNKFTTLAFLLGAVFFFYYITVYFKFGFLSSLSIAKEGMLQRFVTDLGGILGFSIFALLLSILGFVIAWGKKKKFYKIYLLMIALILYSFFYNYAVVYSNFIISILAGIAFSALIRREWKLSLIRNLSILLLFCSLLFSAVSYTVRTADQQPSAEFIETLDWIRENSGEGDVVFSHYTKGFWIQFQAERPVVADFLTYSSQDNKRSIDYSIQAFNSWDIEETRNLLAQYNVSYVLLTSDMSDGLVWGKPEQGLAYLVRNGETFKKEYSNGYAGVWRYIYRENG
jgi:hypothetical protein